MEDDNNKKAFLETEIVETIIDLFEYLPLNVRNLYEQFMIKIFEYGVSISHIYKLLQAIQNSISSRYQEICVNEDENTFSKDSFLNGLVKALEKEQIPLYIDIHPKWNASKKDRIPNIEFGAKGWENENSEISKCSSPADSSRKLNLRAELGFVESINLKVFPNSKVGYTITFWMKLREINDTNLIFQFTNNLNECLMSLSYQTSNFFQNSNAKYGQSNPEISPFDGFETVQETSSFDQSFQNTHYLTFTFTNSQPFSIPIPPTLITDKHFFHISLSHSKSSFNLFINAQRIYTYSQTSTPQTPSKSNTSQNTQTQNSTSTNQAILTPQKTQNNNLTNPPAIIAGIGTTDNIGGSNGAGVGTPFSYQNPPPYPMTLQKDRALIKISFGSEPKSLGLVTVLEGPVPHKLVHTLYSKGPACENRVSFKQLGIENLKTIVFPKVAEHKRDEDEKRVSIQTEKRRQKIIICEEQLSPRKRPRPTATTGYHKVKVVTDFKSGVKVTEIWTQGHDFQPRFLSKLRDVPEEEYLSSNTQRNVQYSLQNPVNPQLFVCRGNSAAVLHHTFSLKECLSNLTTVDFICTTLGTDFQLKLLKEEKQNVPINPHFMNITQIELIYMLQHLFIQNDRFLEKFLYMNGFHFLFKYCSATLKANFSPKTNKDIFHILFNILCNDKKASSTLDSLIRTTDSVCIIIPDRFALIKFTYL